MKTKTSEVKGTNLRKITGANSKPGIFYYFNCIVKTIIKYCCIVFYIRTVLDCWITQGYTESNLGKAGSRTAVIFF